WDDDAYDTQIWLGDVRDGRTRQLTSSKKSSSSPAWSPDGSRLAFISDRTEKRQIYVINPLGGEADALTTVEDGVTNFGWAPDGPDTRPVWSPDGSRIAFRTAMASPSYYYSNQMIAVVSAAGGTPEALTGAFDEDPNIIAWKSNGIFFSASQRTWSYLHRLDPATKAIARLAPSEAENDFGFSISKDGSTVAFMRADAKSMPEVFVAAVGTDPRVGATQDKKLTDMNAQIAGW